jgi:glycosyltransferase involved in cell wall biosynthesis
MNQPKAITPDFSVITCCYNQGEYLEDNIKSVLAQGVTSFEHIVIDSSSDGVAAQVCQRYPHVRYIFQEKSGQSAALNRGFQEARGQIIAWLNSDDYYEQGAFATVIAQRDRLDNKQLIAGGAAVVDQHGRFLWLLRNGRVPFFRLLMHPRLYPFNGWMVMPCQPSVFFAKSMLDEIGLLDTKLKFGMDYEFWLRAMTHGYRFHYIRQLFSYYRYHPTSLTNQGYDTFLNEWSAVSERVLSQLPKADQLRAEMWWKYMRVECFFVQRHKRAEQHVAVRFGHDPSQHPLSRRLLVVLRTALIAPWYPLTVTYHLLAGRNRTRM